MLIDDFKLFGLPPNASFVDVQRQYRIGAKQYHPDRPSGDEEKFNEINNAFGRLENHFKTPPGGGAFVNLFDSFAESVNRRRRCVEIVLTLEELFTGKTINIHNQQVNLPAGMIPNTIFQIPELQAECLIRLARHNYFTIEPISMNIVFRTNISLYEALVGYIGKIKHPNGKMLYISTPKNKVIKDGELMTCKGLGINVGIDHSRAVSDFVVVFHVTMPAHVDVDAHRQVLKTVFECNVPTIIKKPSDIDVALT